MYVDSYAVENIDPRMKYNLEMKTPGIHAIIDSSASLVSINNEDQGGAVLTVIHSEVVET